MVNIPNATCPKCATIVSYNQGERPVCGNCGYGSSAAPAPGYAQPPAYGAPAYGAPPAGQKKGMGIAGMVLGILGLCIPYAGILLALIGLILSAVQLSRIKKDPVQYGGKGMAIAGLVCSIIGLAGAVLILIFVGSILAAAGAGAAGNAILLL